MDASHHPFRELFEQLGLPADSLSIGRFIATHAPLDGAVRLEDAPFWTDAQSRLLREQCLADADWAPVVDQLNAALRHPVTA